MSIQRVEEAQKIIEEQVGRCGALLLKHAPREGYMGVHTYTIQLPSSAASAVRADADELGRSLAAALRSWGACTHEEPYRAEASSPWLLDLHVDLSGTRGFEI